MIATNDELFSVLRALKTYNQNSINAALRRLYVVPMKMESFERMHGRVPDDSPSHQKVKHLDCMFENEPSKLQRIFNLILSVALF